MWLLESSPGWWQALAGACASWQRTMAADRRLQRAPERGKRHERSLKVAHLAFLRKRGGLYTVAESVATAFETHHRLFKRRALLAGSGELAYLSHAQEHIVKRADVVICR